MTYAEGTSVPVSRSQEEVKRVLQKYEASGFAFGEQLGLSLVTFEMAGRRIKMIMPTPIPGKDRGATKYNYVHSVQTAEKETRRRWRCLVIAIKAKLECVASGITTLDEEFLAHIVLPNGNTIGREIKPQIDSAYSNGKMPPLLGYSG